jgi:hypothetical protein
MTAAEKKLRRLLKRALPARKLGALAAEQKAEGTAAAVVSAKTRVSRRVAVTLFDDEAAKLEELRSAEFNGYGEALSRSGRAAFFMSLGMRFYETARRCGADDGQIVAWLRGKPFGPEAMIPSQSAWQAEIGRETAESLEEAVDILRRVARINQLRQGERAIKSLVARVRLNPVPPEDGSAG